MVETAFAIVVGVLYASGLYLMLRRSLVKVVIGLGLLTNATNLLIFTSAGLTRGNPPLIMHGAKALTGAYADPLPQALILTAIVIGFGLQAFALVLVLRTYEITGSEDSDAMTTTEKPDDAAATEDDREVNNS